MYCMLRKSPILFICRFWVKVVVSELVVVIMPGVTAAVTQNLALILKRIIQS